MVLQHHSLVSCLCYYTTRYCLDISTEKLAVDFSTEPFNSIWQHKSGSTLAQVMACCLMAPSHYLNHCWLVFKYALWHSQSNITVSVKATVVYHEFENYYLRPILAFGYCRHLRLSLCPYVWSCVNQELVRAITHLPFKLGSPNFDQKYKTIWLKSLLFWGMVSLPK